MWRCLFLLLALMTSVARADTPLTLFKTFTGNVNFTGTVATNRYNSFFSNCAVYGSNTALSVALAGIPSSATVLSAQLYWAASGDTPDYTVGFESGTVTSTRARSYTSSSIGGGFDYFSGAVDVTPQVIARRNGNYQFYGLAADNGSPYCGSQAVLSGFSLLVVYSDASQPYRTLNLYEGFQYFRNTSYTTTMTGFRIPALTTGVTGRVGHITWEGDANGTGNEDITFNGTRMTDSLNPAGNQFNSQSNINGNTGSLGIDFDAYDVASPIIQAGQASANTVYGSGNDLVLLSAQIVAVPTTPAVDLSLAITRNGAFTAGSPGTYTLSVFNAGPNTEIGPITLSATLPAGVSYVSGEGTRWTCSASGQAVTCKYNGLFTPNTSLPDITLTVLPTAEATITLNASVTGVNYDINGGNNSDSDTTTVTRGAVTYVFTDSACTAIVPFGTSGQCKLLPADYRMLAAKPFPFYLTALSNGVPVARSTTAASTFSLNFAVTCVLPLKNAGVPATINGLAVPLCADGPGAPAAVNNAWSAAYKLEFAANAPSVLITMQYDDVGKVLVSVKDPAGTVASSPTVIWRPDALRLAVNGNPAPSASPDSSKAAPFLAAGTPFSMKVDALMVNGVAAPNFGNGDATVGVALPAVLPTATADEKLIAAAMGNLPKLETAWPNSASGGAFTGTGIFAEVGVPTLVASVTGGYFGVDDVKTGTLKAGRFYPFSFQTVVTPMFAECTKISKVPVCTTGVRGASYATQNFSVNVIPLDVNGNAVQNFRGVFGDKLDLSAVDSAGSVSALSPGGGALTASTVAALPATGSYDAMVATASYALPVPFNRALPASTAWSPSLPIYLRATAQTAVDSGGKVKLTSKQLDKSLEDGVTILNGRLRLSTVPGSELLRLPVTMDAQFWYKPASGAGSWTGNQADNGATPTAIAFSACKRNLLVANACYSGLQMTPKDAAFTAGTARFFIAPPGAGRTGSAMFNMTGAPGWLPSTLAQAVFGVYKSNFIYLRELY
jgi:MSHA biogenesis protein MshQ